MVQTQFGKDIEILRTDNGSEFVNHQVKQLLDELRVLHQKSCVYTPQQNGILERRHMTLLDSTTTLMFHSSVPIKFWPFSILTATWMLNRIPSKGQKTPYEILFGMEPDLSILIPFGCLAFAINLSHHKGKFNTRSNKCIFIGFDASHKGYLLIDLTTNKLLTSRDVKFVTEIFPYANPPENITNSQLPLVHIDDLEKKVQIMATGGEV